MDVRERYQDQEELLRLTWDAFQSTIQTAMPGIILSYDATKMTCTVQPAINGSEIYLDDPKADHPKELERSVLLPKLLDVPVVFPRGGGCTLTFPIQGSETPGVGDECLVVFGSRCIDFWHQNGGWGNETVDLRMHDLSDGFCIPGPFSQKQKLSNVSTTTVQLRNNAGDTFVEMDPTGKVVHIKAPGGCVIDADVTINGTTTMNGDATATGTVTGQTDVKGGSSEISLKAHKHLNTQPGTGQSGGPTN